MLTKIQPTLRLFLFFLVTLLLFSYLGGSYYFSSVLLASPGQSLADSARQQASLTTPILNNLPQPETVYLQNGDITLEGWYFDHPETSCGVVLLHGYGNTRWGVVPYLPIFWELGCDLLLYDARGHGNSSAAYHTYGFYEKADAQTAVYWLAEKAQLPLSQLGLVGTSYGGATALQAAPQLPQLGFILADSTYQDMQTIVTYQAERLFGSVGRLFVPSAFFVAEWRAKFETQSVSPQAAIRQANMPILLTHSREDDFTFASHSETIFANSNQAQTVLHITDWGAGHSGSVITDFAAYRQLVEQFLAEFAPQVAP